MVNKRLRFDTIDCRGVALAAAAASIAFGLFCVRYAGPGHEVIREFGVSGVPYVTLWIFLLFAIWPTIWIGRLVTCVCLGTCLIEFTQLFQNPMWQQLRGSFLGAMILGKNFAWSDFPAYFVGAWLGYTFLQWLTGRQGQM